EWLATHGLTHAGLLALHALSDGPMTQRQLAAASRVEEQTMSRVVERLQRMGHVTRDRDERDRRRVLVRRTPLGDAVVEAIEGSTFSDELVGRRLVAPEMFRAELVRLLTQPDGGRPDVS
ncbi:MAG: MarR family transcriptional regulator, partial [Microlunatus sp.]|nr:MarR family transcriptional regulator [Microlunatus sp.]